MNWSGEQQRMLGAMGFQLLVRVPAGAAMFASHPPASLPVEAPLPAVLTAEFPGLRRALQRAAGEHDIARLVDDLARLRREPALKRALWPRLRALRRSS